MVFTFSKLGWYFGGRFLKSVALVFFAVALLAYTLDLFELLRRAGDNRNITLAMLAGLAVLRLPFVMEQVLPFALLIGAIASFLGLSRRLELVVARSAGISVWQFISPAIIGALLIGILAVIALNPLVSTLKDRADALDLQFFGRRAAVESMGFWLRQRFEGKDAVIRSDRLSGNELTNVTVFLFDGQGQFTGRLEAAKGKLETRRWLFSDVDVIAPGVLVERRSSFSLGTTVTNADLDALAARTPNASFWALPGLINRLDLAGLSSTRYQLRLQSLYSKPLLFVAMVLIAASVSLRFFRMGGVAQMVGFGILAGFSLYVLNQVGQDLGSAGLVSAFAAAWGPAIVAALAAIHVLLRLEDG